MRKIVTPFTPARNSTSNSGAETPVEHCYAAFTARYLAQSLCLYVCIKME